MRTQTWWLVLGLGLAGCESSITRIGPGEGGAANDTASENGDEPGWACDNRDYDGSCQQFTGEAWDRITAASKCDGVVFEGLCAPSDLGGCRRDLGYPLAFVDYYYIGDFYASGDDAFLKADCELNSDEWIP